MRTVIIILAVIFAIAIFLFVPVRVKAYLVYQNSAFKHGYQIKYGFITLKKKKDTKKKKPDKSQVRPEDNTKQKPNPMQVIKFFISNKSDVKTLITKVINYTSKRAIRIEKLSIDAKIGTDDAMQTALIYGGFSAFLYSALAGLDRCIRTRGISVDSSPDFTNPQIFIKIESIIKTTSYNIFAIAVIAIFHALPLLKKRGELKNGKSD